MQNGDNWCVGPGPVPFGRRRDVNTTATDVLDAGSPGFGRRENAQAATVETAAPQSEGRLDRHGVYDIAGALSREEELATFFGPNAEAFLPTYRAWEASGARADSSILSWHAPFRSGKLWAAFFFPVPWLFYRKLYGHGVAALAAITACAILAPHIISGVLSLVISSLVMRYGKRLYVDRAMKTVAIADERGFKDKDRASFLRGAGGLSALGLLVGVLLYTVPIALTVATGS